MIEFKNKFKIIIPIFLVSLFFSFGLVFSVQAACSENSTANYGLDATACKAGILDLDISTKNALIIGAEILGIALSFLGILFFGIILYAGLKWMLALGDANKVETAKSMLESAGIGLLIVLASYALATFIFKYLGIT